MSQAKVQAPYMPGLKEPADLVDEPGKSKFGDQKQQQQQQQQERDYYSPVATEVVEKSGSKPSQGLDGPREGAEMNDLYSPNAAVDIATSKKQPENHNSNDTKAAGSNEREKSLGKERMTMLPLPTEPLDAVHRTLKGTFDTTRDAVNRTKQSLLDRIFPPSSAHKVVEEMEKDVLGNSEGSGHDMSQTRQGPKASETGAPHFMRARL